MIDAPASISERDRKLLESGNVRPLNWQDCKDIIASKDLERFIRSPAQIREYLAKREYFNAEFGGTANYVVSHRLCWTGKTKPASSKFLNSAADVKILLNDFPYYFEQGIVHYVVWSKVRGEITAEQQFTPAISKVIHKFLADTFSRFDVSADEIMWFKNTNNLQSVPTLEHFHVLVRGHEPITALLGTAGCLGWK